MELYFLKKENDFLNLIKGINSYCEVSFLIGLFILISFVIKKQLISDKIQFCDFCLKLVPFLDV